MQKSCTIQWEFQHLNMLSVSTATYILLSELTGHQFLHTVFPADLSLYLLLKVYMQGMFWGQLHSSTRFICFFLLCVHILCVSVFHQLCGIPCVCPSYFLCMSAFCRSLHTSSSGLHTHFCLSFCLCIFEYMCWRIHISICEIFFLNYT